MMKSIRSKLFLIFLVFMVSLVAFGILLNGFFLEKYYIYKNEEIFVDISERIENEYASGKKNITNFIGEIDRVEGVSTIITDKNFTVKYNSFFQKGDPENLKVPGEVSQLVTANDYDKSKGYIYSVVEKTSVETPKLVYIKKLNGGDVLILRKQMKGIKESVVIANEFYIFAGAIIICFGSIFIFFFSKSITKPIAEMSKVAEGISNLDFQKRITYNSKDEIGNLGDSINNISMKLSENMEVLKEDVERRKELVRNMSHELKTPIAVIKGYAEGLKFGVADNEEKREKYCNIISDECTRMDSMVRELLNLSMLESGSFQLKQEDIDLNKLVSNILSRLEKEILKAGVKVEVQSLDKIIGCGDPELIDRAISNYVINGINHAEGLKEIRISMDYTAKGVRLSVYNSGKNIKPENMDNLWEIFYKVDKARSRQYGGHGLGLAIVKLIMELHQGTYGVSNKEGGVEFFIEIPKKS